MTKKCRLRHVRSSIWLVVCGRSLPSVEGPARWHSKNCFNFCHNTTLSHQKRVPRLLKMWHQIQASYTLRNFTHIHIWPFFVESIGEIWLMWEVFRNNCLMDIAFEKRKHLNLFRNTFTGQINVPLSSKSRCKGMKPTEIDLWHALGKPPKNKIVIRFRNPRTTVPPLIKEIFLKKYQFSLGPSYRMGRVYKWIWCLCVCVCVRHHFEYDHYICS